MSNAVNRELQRRLEEDPILEIATSWFVELQGAEVPVERVREWQLWCASDVRHRAAYQSIESLWGTVENVDSQLWPGPEDVSSDRYDPDISVAAWRARRPRSVSRYALAASLLIGVTIALSQISAVRNWLSPSAMAVETQTGERRKIRLSDGSVVTVGGRSLISASITQQTRVIKLDSGEAFFDVAKDPARPFIVHVGKTAITAIGTQFNVRRSTDRVVVSVAEGVVLVDRPAEKKDHPDAVWLIAGEQLSVASTGTIDSRQAVDAGAVGGWRAGQLHYLNEPLAAVVADVRRYAARDIEIADPSIGHLRITGTVFENDVDSWLRTLETAFPIQATTDSTGEIVLRSTASR